MKQNWTPTQETFRKFLHWLDEGVDSGGERYLEMRRRLVFYFDRKNCLSPDDLADETLNRVARKLEEKGSISGLSPAHYCYIVARFVFLEYLRSEDRETAAQELLDTALEGNSPAGPAFGDPSEEQVRLGCLEQCLNKLEGKERDLILEYYQGEQRSKIERRAQLAARLGVSLNALSIRACRIRNKLEDCVRKCLRSET
ncbi:MAG TPA: sigma-70 family RNA polymerase sigma factor [Terriglobales bacterium]